jgi:hypothetical protein
MTAGITLVPHSVLAFGHQFETTALNTIWAAGFLHGPKGRGEGHSEVLAGKLLTLFQGALSQRV